MARPPTKGFGFGSEVILTPDGKATFTALLAKSVVEPLPS
jgi:hypothetical protein